MTADNRYANRHSLERRAQRGQAAFAFAPGTVAGYRRPARGVWRRACRAAGQIAAFALVACAGAAALLAVWLVVTQFGSPALAWLPGVR